MKKNIDKNTNYQKQIIPVAIALVVIGIFFLSFVSAISGTVIEKEIVVVEGTFANNTAKLIVVSNSSRIAANSTNITLIPLTPIPAITLTNRTTITPIIIPTFTPVFTPIITPITPMPPTIPESELIIDEGALKIKITPTKDHAIPSKTVRTDGELIAIPETTVRLNTTTIEEANKYIAIFELEYSMEVPIKTPNLRVTTETTVDGRDMSLTIRIENIGDAEARNITLVMDRPSELKKASLGGAYATLGETIIRWDGERLAPGNVHVIDYKMRFAEEPDDDLEFPISVSWEDIEGNEWLMSFVLELLLAILKTIPGFEAIFAIGGVLTVYLIRSRKVKSK